jgi:lysozyme
MASDKINFYLEDEDKYPMEGWHDTGRTRKIHGEEFRVQHPDIIPSGVDWLDKGREKLWSGMYRGLEPVAGFLTEAITPRTQSGVSGMVEDPLPPQDAISGLPNVVSDRERQARSALTIGSQRTVPMGVISQAETVSREPPRSVAEAQARNEKYFYTESGVKKLAITAAQLEEFKKSSAYDPKSEKSALTQWANAMPLHMPAEEVSVQEDVSLAPSRRDVFDMSGSDVRAILAREEGVVLDPYGDVGKKAVGVGHVFKKGEKERSVSNSEAMQLLEKDISNSYASVDRLIKKFGVEGKVPPALRDELMMMAFQMGATGLSKFKNMWKGIKNQDWSEVVAQMADSRWAKSQTPNRAERTISRVKKLFGV